MKQFIFLCGFLLIFSCKTKKSVAESDESLAKTVKIVSASEVDNALVNKASKLGTRLLETCNTSKFKPFNSDEATESVIQNSTASKIAETCKKINFRNGKFISLDLIEIKLDEINNRHIFRYSINYEKTYFKRELTIYMNSDNKISSINTKEIKPKPL